MSAALVVLAAAGIGGRVSPASVFLTQRGAERGWTREHERTERHRQEDQVRQGIPGCSRNGVPRARD